MRSPFRLPLLPKPVSFSDDVKAHCAHVERKWGVLGGGFTLAGGGVGAAAALGAAVPPLMPFMAVGAGVCLLLEKRARWGKEDPPRDDYRMAVVLPQRRIDTFGLSQLVPPQTLGDEVALADFLRFVSLTEEAGHRLGATVEALEKSLGAAEREGEEAQGYAAARFYQARNQALLTSFVLRSVSRSAESVAEELPAWFPFEVESKRVESLWGAIDAEEAGRLLAIGLDPVLLEARPDQEDSLGSLEDLPGALAEAGEAARGLAEQLEIWASEDNGPEPAELGDIAPQTGPAAAISVPVPEVVQAYA